MDYQIETKGPMTVYGFERCFTMETAKQEIPAFWDEFFKNGWLKKVSPLVGVCLGDDSQTDFPYLIGNFCDPDMVVPEGMVKRSIPAHTWALFHTEGTDGKDIQELNYKIYTQWLPTSTQYEPASAMNIEVYPCEEMDWEDKRWGIWLPVKAK